VIVKRLTRYFALILLLCFPVASSCFNLTQLVNEIPASCVIIVYSPIDEISGMTFEGYFHPILFLRMNLISEEFRNKTNQIQKHFHRGNNKIFCALNLFYLYHNTSKFVEEAQGPYRWRFISIYGLDRDENNDNLILLMGTHQGKNTILSKNEIKIIISKIVSFIFYLLEWFQAAFLVEENTELTLFVQVRLPCRFVGKSCLFSPRKVQTLSLSLFTKQENTPNVISIQHDNFGVQTVSALIASSKDAKFVFLRLVLSRTKSTLAGVYSQNYPTIVMQATDCSRCIAISMKTTEALTCYSPPFITFHMYVKPFDCWIWIFIVVNGFSLSLLIFVHLVFYRIQLPHFSMLLLYIRTLTEEPIDLPQAFNKFPWLKVIIIVWLLESGMLLSIYTSQLISESNAPLKGSLVENLSEVFCDPVSREETNYTYVLNNIGKLLESQMNSSTNAHLRILRYIMFLKQNDKRLRNIDHKVIDKNIKRECFFIVNATGRQCEF